jgi:MFS transporter, FHS family, L-fucose permease
MVTAVKYPQPSEPKVMPNRQNNTAAIGVVSTLFFLFGFITCLNDILVPHLKEVFSLNYTESMLVQFTFFGAYFIISWPASKLISKYGYKKSFIIGLVLTALGCLSFIFSAKVSIYLVFLCGLSILASGIVILQVAANPYLTILGKPERASSRLIFAQGLNSLGATIAPIIGSALILSVALISKDDLLKLSDMDVVKYHAAQVSAVQVPYFGLACFVILIAIALSFFKFPSNKTEASSLSVEKVQNFRFFDHPKLVLGTLAIFAYVGAEVAIGSLMVNFIAHPDIGNMSLEKAGYYLPYYWGGAMVGRFIGSYITTKFQPNKVLLVHAIMASLLVTFTIFGNGHFALYSIIAVGLFNSIMFPSIFVLSTQNLGKFMEKGSGIICMAIVGGAIIPMIQGFVADSVNLSISYIIPLLCYIYIAVFALKTKSNVGLN